MGVRLSLRNAAVALFSMSIDKIKHNLISDYVIGLQSAVLRFLELIVANHYDNPTGTGQFRRKQ